MTVRNEAVAVQVREALANDRRISGLPIEIRVSEGEVFIKGSVESPEQKDIVEFILRGIPGVRHIVLEELQIREENK
jgi:osmotically-inducible protein OsmY